MTVDRGFERRGGHITHYDQGRQTLVLGATGRRVGQRLTAIVFNVPRNNALVAVHTSDLEGGRFWSAYVAAWTGWNRVRTTASLPPPR